MLRDTLFPALVALAFFAGSGCDGDAGTSTSGGTNAPAAARASEAQAPLERIVPFPRNGRSVDLLCALAPTSEAGLASVAEELADALAATAPACACADTTPSCRHVELHNDRRRALLVAPGSTLRARLDLGDGEESRLRLAVGAVDERPTRLAFRVVVSDPATGTRSEWSREVRVVERWVDAEIDLAAFRPARSLDLEIDVADGPQAPPGAMAAIATPRLVAPVSPTADQRPVNVIVYLIDTLRTDRTSAYGYSRDTTPHLVSLARAGVLFENAYGVASWTRPAIASLFTSLYPGAHGVDVGTGLERAAVTLAERFHDAGWSTWAFVANVQIFAPEFRFDQGFDRFVSFPGKDGGHIARTDWVNARLFDQLEAAGDEPFFLYVHAMEPHAPYNPPPGYVGRFGDPAYGGQVRPIQTQAIQLRLETLGVDDLAQVRDLYDEDVRFQDDMLGKLLQRLARSGLDRRTVVVVLADHGEELFDRGDWEHGARLFEEQIHIPLVVRVPGVGGLAGRRIAAPVQIVDVMPTLLHWFGLPAVDVARGRDLTPLLAGDGESAGTAADAVSPRDAGARADADRPIYCEERRADLGFDLLSLTDGGWKIIRRVSTDGESSDLLFDLARDPGERANLAAAEPERLATLGRRLAALRRERGAGSTSNPNAAVELDDATRRQLESLGYLERPGSRTAP